MGFHVIIDIIGSVIIGGILLLTLLNMKTANTENSYKYAGNSILQENLITITEILDNEFKQIGWTSDSVYKNPILIAARNRIKFLTDIKPTVNDDPDKVQDQIEYYFNGADSNTPNPNDTLLTRTVTTTDSRFNQAGAAISYNFGIRNLKFTYRDITGQELTSLSTQPQRNNIYSITVDITMQRTFLYKRENVKEADQFNKETAVWQRIFYLYRTTKRNQR